MSDQNYQTPKADVIHFNLLEKVDNKYRLQDPGKLPSYCVKCGADHSLIKINKKFYYVNPAIYLWLLLSIFALIIAYYVARKGVNIEYTKCQDCNKKANHWTYLAIALSLALIVALSLMAQYKIEDGIVVFVSLVSILLLVLFAMVMRSNGFRIHSHDYPYFYIKGFKKEFETKINSQS